MQIGGVEGESYLFINGIEVPRPLRIGDWIELLPANFDHNLESILEVAGNELSLGVMAIFLHQIKSQLKITERDPKIHAVLAWNSTWDVLLLGAIFDCETGCNFQSRLPIESFGRESNLHITNYHLRGLTREIRKLSSEEADWVEANFEKARQLLTIPEFKNAIHCMATYRWHAHPRARLALLWSGIEGLFKIESEIVFRLSLYIANYLEPDDQKKRRDLFANVKNLYKHRSAAVHGSKIRNDAYSEVEKSASLLNRLILSCVDTGGIPCIEKLAP